MKKSFLLVVGFVFAGCIVFSSSARSQELPPSGEVVASPLDSLMQPVPPSMPSWLLSVQSDQPANPAFVAAIRRAAKSGRPIRILDASGATREGVVMEMNAHSLILRTDRNTVDRSMKLLEIQTVQVLKDPPAVAFRKGAETAAAVALIVVTLPLGFVWGLSCGFQCS